MARQAFSGGVGVAGAFNLGRVYWGSVPAWCPGADVPAGRKLWVAARQSHRDLQQPPQLNATETSDGPGKADSGGLGQNVDLLR